MCGITGYYGFVNKNVLKSMHAELHHRGPDDDGFYFEDFLGLAHNRLSIIDLSPDGHQPMTNEDKSVWLVFNGEIYNFSELKKDLIRKGHKFKSQSDSEVIIHLYEEMGLNCFAQLNGMFAIAIWDKNKNKLILARDRVGEKPLFWAKLKDNFYFSSELKAFTKIPECKKNIDQLSFIKFVDQGYIAGPNTIFQSIKKLLPGHYLIYQNKTIQIKPFWNLSLPAAAKHNLSLEESIRQLDSILSEAVKIRLMSDVPLGVFLSGGLDSSLIAHYAQTHSQQKIKTFSIQFADAAYDESTYAAQVAQHLGTEHQQKLVSDEQLISIIDSLPEIMDEPLADASIIPTYWLSKITKNHVTVALGGDGADEFFLGYQTNLAWSRWHWLAQLPAPLRQFCGQIVSSLPSRDSYFSLDFKLKRALLNFDTDFFNQHFRWFSPFSITELKNLLHFEFSLNNYADNYPAAKINNPILESTHLYQKNYLPDDIFTKVDRAAMAVSLETRAPFVDYRVIEFTNSLPLEQKLHGRETKYILKKLAEKYLPPSIIYRSKHGFAPPLDAWLRGPLKHRVVELFEPQKINQLGLLNPFFVKYLWQDFLAGNHYRSRQIWTLFIWQLWAEKYLS